MKKALPAKPQKPADPHEVDEQDDAVIGLAFRWSLAFILLALFVAAPIAYFALQKRQLPVTERSKLTLPEVRQISRAEIPHTPFSDVTTASGVTFDHENGAYGDKLLPETMGGGCAVFDFDADGDQDLLFVNSNYWPWDDRAKGETPPPTMALYANDGSMQFTDVTREAGLTEPIFGMGCAVGDYNNDGHVDLYITGVGKNRLYQNVGGKFRDVTEEAGVAGGDTNWSTSCGWLDYDNDGLLDLVVCNYVQWSKELDLKQEFKLDGVGRAYGPPTAFQGTYPLLFHNEGDGVFRDASESSKIRISNHATGVPAAKSMGVAPVDLDRDGWIDIVIANDTVGNFVFRNRRDGTFEEIGTQVGVAYDSTGQARGAMGIDAAYFRNNSSLGVAIGNFANEATALYVCNDEFMIFTDQSIATGLGPPTRLELTFGLFFFDYDLDGRLDIFAANGHLEEDINKVQQSQQYAQPPQLFWNTGGKGPSEFVKVSSKFCGPTLHQRMVGRGAAYGDLDGDGDLDIVVTASGGAPRILRNDQSLGRRWVRFKLVGKQSNRDAIGGWVEIDVAGETRRRKVMPTRSYLSQVELPVTFGLREHESLDKVVVVWPGGVRQPVENAKIDQLNVVEQQ